MALSGSAQEIIEIVITAQPSRPSQIFDPPKLLPKTDDFKHIETKSNDSLSSDLGFDPKKPRRKASILDDLLGIGESSAKATPPVKQAKQQASVSRQTTSETISEHAIIENPSAARKAGRRQSAVVFSDPLGLFGPSEKEKEQIKKAQTKSARKSIAGSEWLFNDPTQAEKGPSPFMKLKSSPAIQITANSDEKADDEPVSSNVTSLDSKTTLPLTNPQKNQPQLMESLVSETTNTLNNMKQQEFQLMVATQMRSQENVLIEMKNKQVRWGRFWFAFCLKFFKDISIIQRFGNFRSKQDFFGGSVEIFGRQNGPFWETLRRPRFLATIKALQAQAKLIQLHIN